MPLSTAQQQEACSYAILALVDGEAEITSNQIASILGACNVTVEPYWPALYAGLKNKAADLVLEGGGGSGGGGGGGGDAAAAGGAAAPAEEEKVEEEEEEIDMGGGMDMFGGDEGGGGDY